MVGATDATGVQGRDMEPGLLLEGTEIRAAGESGALRKVALADATVATPRHL